MKFSTWILILAPTVCTLPARSAAAEGAADARPRVGVLAAPSPGVMRESVDALIGVLRRESLDVVESDVAGVRQDDADALLLLDAAYVTPAMCDVLRRHARAGKPVILLGPEPLSKPTEPFGRDAVRELGDLLELHCEARTVRVERGRTVLATTGPAFTSRVDFTPVFCVPRDGRCALIPLLRSEGEPAETAAALMVHYGGAFAGSRWLLSGIATDHIVRDPSLAEWLARSIGSLLAASPGTLPAPRTDTAAALGVTTAYSGYALMLEPDGRRVHLRVARGVWVRAHGTRLHDARPSRRHRRQSRDRREHVGAGSAVRRAARSAARRQGHPHMEDDETGHREGIGAGWVNPSVRIRS